jgi:hypothetical protein
MELAEIIAEYAAWQAQQEHPDMRPQAFEDHYYTQKVLDAVLDEYTRNGRAGLEAGGLTLDMDTLTWLESQTTGSEIE